MLAPTRAQEKAMALEINKLVKEEGDQFEALERLCLTEDDRLVPESDPAARWLYCKPGDRIPKADADRYGLTAKPESKQRRKPADKAVKEPDGDKAD